MSTPFGRDEENKVSKTKRVYRTTLVTLGDADKCTKEQFLEDAHKNFAKWLEEHPPEHLAYEEIEVDKLGNMKQVGGNMGEPLPKGAPPKAKKPPVTYDDVPPGLFDKEEAK